jgi:hypothetical protein
MKRVSTTMMAAALLFLLSACVIEPGIGSGQKVSVMFSASTGNEAGDDIVLRSAATAESETQTVSLGHGLFLSATLKPDTAGAGGELRAAEPLKEGQKVYLLAYEAGTLKGTVLYTQTSGNLVAEGGNGLVVEIGKTYNFIAYSYYDNTTDTPSATNVDPAKDLVWGQQAGKTIADNDRTVSIVMTRRFSQAKVRISCSTVANAEITDLGDVEMVSRYADLSIPDGTLTKGADIPLTVPFTFNSTNDITSDEPPQKIYPGVRVNIESMTVEVSSDPAPFVLSDLSLEFDNLTAGKNYVLEVIITESRWAHSNIYWQAVAQGDARYPGYLTFDTENQGHQGYQGVFFRWGSLVGISPALTSGNDNEGQAYSRDTPIYLPYYVEGGTSTWSCRIGSRGALANPYSTWNAVSSTGGHAPSTDIPYLDASYNAEPYGTYNTYASDAARNTTAMYDSLRGDICQYLGKTDPALNGFRLPQRDEFWAEVSQTWTTSTATSDGWIKGPGTFSTRFDAGYVDGRADFLSNANGEGIPLGSGKNLATGVELPAGGYRSGSSSRLSNVGYYGYHWSCSALSVTHGWELFFTNTYVGNSGIPGMYRSSAAPVRCMRKLPGEP